MPRPRGRGRIRPLRRAEIDGLFTESRRLAQRAGLRKSEVRKAVTRARRAR